jgi:hypothetical protein
MLVEEVVVVQVLVGVEVFQVLVLLLEVGVGYQEHKDHQQEGLLLI